jgi:hypothetical protein
MFDGEVEQYEWHWFVRHLIVVGESIVSAFLESKLVHYFFIRTIWNTKWSVNISEKKSSELIKSLNFTIFVGIKMIEDGIEVLSEWGSSAFSDAVKHPRSVFIVNKTITKDSNTLVSPESQGGISSGEFFLGAHAHTANNFREISKIESVMSLHWSRSQIKLNLFINFHSSSDNLLLLAGYVW